MGPTCSLAVDESSSSYGLSMGEKKEYKGAGSRNRKQTCIPYVRGRNFGGQKVLREEKIAKLRAQTFANDVFPQTS